MKTRQTLLIDGKPPKNKMKPATKRKHAKLGTIRNNRTKQWYLIKMRQNLI